ncbi:caffeoyl-CoA O-methyltransferase [Trifolium repens]|nr:caffeoyl-CoA O-methyltransferase [Trifolium repens]
MDMYITKEEKEQNIPIPYRDSGYRSLLQSDALYDYILETSVLPREHPCLKELREMTDKHPLNLMATSADEGQLLSLLVKLINAKNTMEIGVYTGYSLLCTALALPSDGKVLALDINREYYDLGLPMIEKAGENNKGTFDFIFVDADKNNYLNYHKRVIELVKIGGLIGYDNTLWTGSVALAPDAPMLEFIRGYRGYVIEVNNYLAQDSRIEICQLAVGDGITLCRRLS